jgi:hypothetical protein
MLEQVADSVEDLNPKCIAHCQEFSVEALQSPQVGLARPPCSKQNAEVCQVESSLCFSMLPSNVAPGHCRTA